MATQLLLQHSNVDYAAGPFHRVLALNAAHRFHHLRWAGVGDVNFGLCRRVKAAVLTDEDDRYRRLRRGRYCRSWTDRDGAVRLSARLTPDEGARLLAEVDARRDEMVADARAGGWYEGPDAHRADALVDLARTARGGADGATAAAAPAAMVHVRVDHEALTRGHTVAGERCEIPGVGPIPVSVARRIAEDAILKILITKGVEITAVAHGGRTIPPISAPPSKA